MLFVLGLQVPAWAQLPTATQVASQIKVGWNIGNTLEAPPGETAWGNPMVSQTLINSVKNAGFNAVRIPCAWDSHQTNGVIHATWLARVKQVVDYCVNNNMYAIINIHWDGGWLEEHPLYSHQTAVNAKQRNYWTQIANYFKGYNERLLFAGANEVRADYNTPTTEHINVHQSYLQTFVDAVRATGGNNSTRPLIVQTYNTNAFHGINYFWLPNDPASNRLIVEIHNYDPYDFTLNPNSSCLYWGSPYPSQSACSWAQEAYIDDYYNKVKAEWVDKGVPVIVGEFAANLRSSLSGTQLSTHQASRQYWVNYVTKVAYQRGIKSFYWDNGVRDNGGKLFDRNTGAITDQGIVNAIMSAVGTTPPPPPPPTGTWTMFKNRATGLQIDGMSRTTNGSNVSQWATSSSGGQQWMVETVGSYVKLRNRATGLYLDGMGRTTNGSVCGQYSSSSSNNQQWTIETVGSYVKLRNRGTGLYLDGMGRTANGSDLGQYASGSSNNQQWTRSTVSARLRQDGTEEVEVTESNISVSPNPFVSELNVTVGEPKNVHKILMMDLTGKEVEVIEHENVRHEQLMGRGLKAGMYILHINEIGNRQTFKVIKK